MKDMMKRASTHAVPKPHTADLAGARSKWYRKGKIYWANYNARSWGELNGVKLCIQCGWHTYRTSHYENDGKSHGSSRNWAIFASSEYVHAGGGSEEHKCFKGIGIGTKSSSWPPVLKCAFSLSIAIETLQSGSNASLPKPRSPF